MIRIDNLTKRYGKKTAVDGLTFAVKPGVVTGFLGPNGSGKSTTMRLLIGLDRPSSGSATVNGKQYTEHEAPLHEVGVLLEHVPCTLDAPRSTISLFRRKPRGFREPA